MAVPEIIAVTKDVALGTAALVAATVSILGLRTWRRQLHGQTQFAVAHKFVRAAYKVRDAFSFVRRRSFLSSENEAVEGSDTRDADGRFDEVKAYRRRWRVLESAFAELEVESLEAEVIWGQVAIDALMKPIRIAVDELKWRLFEFTEAGRRELSHQDAQVLVGIRHKFLGAFDGKEDDLAVQVRVAMDAVDKWKVKYIRS